jgi:hypothetical protein
VAPARAPDGILDPAQDLVHDALKAERLTVLGLECDAALDVAQGGVAVVVVEEGDLSQRVVHFRAAVVGRERVQEELASLREGFVRRQESAPAHRVVPVRHGAEPARVAGIEGQGPREVHPGLIEV